MFGIKFIVAGRYQVVLYFQNVIFCNSIRQHVILFTPIIQVRAGLCLFSRYSQIISSISWINWTNMMSLYESFFYCSTCFACYYIHPQEPATVCRCIVVFRLLSAPTCIWIPPYSSRTAPIHQYTPKHNNTPTYSRRLLRMNVITFETCWAIKKLS